MATYWSCAQTHPHREKLALVNLRRQRFTSFFPYFLLRDRRGRLVIKAAFPGYVFIRLDDDLINWAPINFTLGVTRLLTRPSPSEYRLPCRADFVNELHRMRIMGLDEDEAIETDVIPPGTTIKIIRGPFCDRAALVTMSSADRVKVMLQAFNREIILECDADAVERAA